MFEGKAVIRFGLVNGGITKRKKLVFLLCFHLCQRKTLLLLDLELQNVCRHLKSFTEVATSASEKLR